MNKKKENNNYLLDLLIDSTFINGTSLRCILKKPYFYITGSIIQIFFIFIGAFLGWIFNELKLFIMISAFIGGLIGFWIGIKVQKKIKKLNNNIHQ